MFKEAKPIVRVVGLLIKKFEDSGSSNEDRTDEKACIKKAILMLKDETQAKKSFHIEKFVENTILNSESTLEPATIFSLLTDIEQMSWRQLCLLAGFTRINPNSFEIKGYDGSGIDGRIRRTDIDKLTDLRYLSLKIMYPFPSGTTGSFDNINVSAIGKEISDLMNLDTVEDGEIAKAFGAGMIQKTDIL